MGAPGLVAVLAAVAAETPPPPQSPPKPQADAVQGVEVVGRAPVIGDLQKGVLNYRPEFFTPVRPTTAMDMVQWLPGFVFQDTRDLRGLGGAGGNVLIDGKPPTSKTDTLQNVLRRIPSGQIERVDIIVGGAPGIDMRGWPVVANVILKQSAKRRRLVGLSNIIPKDGHPRPELLLTTSQNTGTRTVEASLTVGANWAIGPGFGDGRWLRRDGNGGTVFDARTRIAGYGPYAVGSAAYERPFAGGKLKANGLVTYYRFHIDDDEVLTPPPGRNTYDEFRRYLKGEAGLRYERPLTPKLSLEAQALERLTRESTDNDIERPPQPSTFHSNDDSHETIGRATLRWRRSDRLTLDLSAEAAFNGTVARSARTVAGVPQVLPAENVDVSEQRDEAGSTLSWKPNAAFSLDAAAKVETSSLSGRADGPIGRGFTYFKPRLVMTWSPDKASQLRVRVEHEVGQVAFSNFAAFSEYNSGQVRAGNPDLRPDHAWVAEAVVERRFWTGGDLMLTVRRKRLLDPVDVVPMVTATGVVGVVANIGDGWQTDAILNLTLPLKRLGLTGGMLRGSLTWTRSRVPDPLDGRLRQLSSQQEFQGELHFAQDLPLWKLNTGFDLFYAGHRVFYRPFGNERGGDWVRLNLFVEYAARPDLNLRAELGNLPGNRVRTSDDYYAGLRGASAFLYHDEKTLSSGPYLFLRVRRTLE